MATFLPASIPSISAVGSASAYPSSVARARASENSIPSWDILVRIKFVVPFTIPITSVTWLASRLFFNGLMIGIPPATAASNRKSFCAALAVSRISFPWTAIRSLFAETTCLPAFNAERIYSFAGLIPPISSITISISGSFIISSHWLVSKEASSIFAAAFSIFLTRIFFISILQPILADISFS